MLILYLLLSFLSLPSEAGFKFSCCSKKTNTQQEKEGKRDVKKTGCLSCISLCGLLCFKTKGKAHTLHLTSQNPTHVSEESESLSWDCDSAAKISDSNQQIDPFTAKSSTSTPTLTLSSSDTEVTSTIVTITPTALSNSSYQGIIPQKTATLKSNKTSPCFMSRSNSSSSVSSFSSKSSEHSYAKSTEVINTCNTLPPSPAFTVNPFRRGNFKNSFQFRQSYPNMHKEGESTRCGSIYNPSKPIQASLPSLPTGLPKMKEHYTEEPQDQIPLPPTLIDTESYEMFMLYISHLISKLRSLISTVSSGTELINNLSNTFIDHETVTALYALQLGMTLPLVDEFIEKFVVENWAEKLLSTLKTRNTEIFRSAIDTRINPLISELLDDQPPYFFEYKGQHYTFDRDHNIHSQFICRIVSYTKAMHDDSFAALAVWLLVPSVLFIKAKVT